MHIQDQSPDTQRTVSPFRNNGSQALRIPLDLELPDASATIEQLAYGSLLIRPADTLVTFIAVLDALPTADWMDPVEELPVEPVAL